VNDVSTSYETTGRVNQKQRTRGALIASARTLLAERGAAPTVEEVAAAVSISRTTAYRYFPSQTALIAAAHPEIDTASLLPADVGDDPHDRLLAAVGAFISLTIDTEPQLRAMLRLSLEATVASSDESLPLRKGRAIGWFEEALEPLRLRLGPAGLRKLAVAVRSATGIESLVWLTDVAGLSREEAAGLMLWSAQAVLNQAMADGELPESAVLS
jgi:AcrR family transcriptional regulator